MVRRDLVQDAQKSGGLRQGIEARRAFDEGIRRRDVGEVEMHLQRQTIGPVITKSWSTSEAFCNLDMVVVPDAAQYLLLKDLSRPGLV